MADIDLATFRRRLKMRHTFAAQYAEHGEQLAYEWRSLCADEEALLAEVERLRALVGSLDEDATAHMPGEPQTVTLPVTYNMYPAALALKRLLPPERVSQLWEALVQVEGDTYIVDVKGSTHDE